MNLILLNLCQSIGEVKSAKPPRREREHRTLDNELEKCYSIFANVLGVSGVGESFMSHAVGLCDRARMSHAACL